VLLLGLEARRKLGVHPARPLHWSRWFSEMMRGLLPTTWMHSNQGAVHRGSPRLRPAPQLLRRLLLVLLLGCSMRSAAASRGRDPPQVRRCRVARGATLQHVPALVCSLQHVPVRCQ
jgi:hypothetical protein